jgi:hypothetical protein
MSRSMLFDAARARMVQYFARGPGVAGRLHPAAAPRGDHWVSEAWECGASCS